MAAPYYGWYVVAACATIACFSRGFAFYGLGVYLHVLVRLYLRGNCGASGRRPS
jgi:hypothetical protein